MGLTVHGEALSLEGNDGLYQCEDPVSLSVMSLESDGRRECEVSISVRYLKLEVP